MIVLDTNVLSELMKPEPDEAVFAWVAGRPASSRACGASVATRNVSDFEGCGVAIVNPWEE